MTHVKDYWLNKEERKKQAVKHTKEMGDRFLYEICNSRTNSKIYSDDNVDTLSRDYKLSDNVIPHNNKTDIIIEDLDSVSAVRKYYSVSKTVAVLNYASYKNPGGMFMEGSIAQEESLCHGSNLYNIISQFFEYYDWNNQHKNKALYLNRALYTPDVCFMMEDNGYCMCDVITCAAPNKSAAQKYQNVSDRENTDSLSSRIKFVLDIAVDNEVDTLILGAYGCGVFGQNPYEVASIFKLFLEGKYKNTFDKVIFAIPDSTKNDNLKAFKSVFDI
jgi:uncharacterized protein (TIGR02452 family)